MSTKSTYINFKQTFSRWASNSVTCPACLDNHILKDFEKHVATVHHINTKKSCIFCLGNFEWLQGNTQSQPVNDHRLKCMKMLTRHYKVMPKRQRKRPESDYCLTCDEPLRKIQRKTLRGREKHKEWGRFYESDVGTKLPYAVDSIDHVAFSEESGLGNDIYPIFKHFQQNKQYQWYHVMVKAAVWNDFEREILSLDDVYTVPYGCLFDGKKIDLRHMVLVVHEKSAYLRVWRQKIKLPKNVKAKWNIKIKTEEHLSNVLYYVSNPKAQCDGIIDGALSGSHYALERHMYPHAKLAMAALYPGGFEQYVRRRALHLDPTPWFHQVNVSRNGLYPRVVPIRHLDLPIRGCYLPLAKNMRFSEVMTLEKGQNPPNDCPFLWMYGKNQIVLLETVEALDKVSFETWRLHQMDRGNVFLEALDCDEYVLGSNHVKTVAMLKRYQSVVQEKERDLLNKIESLKEELNAREEEMNKLKSLLKEE